MPNTPKGFPYPSASDDADVPGDMAALALAIDAYVPSVFGDVTLTGTQTLTNKTLTSPTINSGTLNTVTENNPIMISPEERTTVTAAAPTATTNFDALTQGVHFYTSNATTNFTLNFRGNAGTTLNAMLATGDAYSCVLLVTNGATPFRPTAFQIDGTSVTPRWAGGAAPAAGNANSTDSYSFTIIKTAATPTYTVLAGLTRFA